MKKAPLTIQVELEELADLGQPNANPAPFDDFDPGEMSPDRKGAFGQTSLVTPATPLSYSQMAKVAFAVHPLQEYTKFQNINATTLNKLGPLDEDLEGKPSSSSQSTSHPRTTHPRIRELSDQPNLLATALSPTGRTPRLKKLLTIKEAFQDDPKRKELVDRIERKEKDTFDSVAEKILNELFITGELVFNWFTPAERGRHNVMWTMLFTFMVCILYFFMAGNYNFWLVQTDRKVHERDTGPQLMVDFVLGRNNTDGWQSFEFDYLLTWGGRYDPAIKEDGQHWRWFTSLFLHTGFNHLLSNLLLFIALAAHLEIKYGTPAVLLIWLISGLGGNFFSAMFEDSCILVVGASGSVFGFVGLFFADMVLNFETLKRPLLRALSIVIFSIYFVLTVTTESNTSHLSHVGGFLCGLFPSFLVLPNFRAEKWEAMLPWAGLIVMVATFCIFPAIVYQVKFAELDTDC
ncbi:hypothetical protein CYMTET_38690 [Cymbomonas tetramitiformis]|uniref:RHOMBOID-like protein n=1 Tax=Cymbomonas tetramitiformis TaxID=36881 RepID=A0AAE0CDL5_9CHLO|nr:hypothetical protein CYMTET_38690 [Cymbomonas tetramitiformis]